MALEEKLEVKTFPKWVLEALKDIYDGYEMDNFAIELSGFINDKPIEELNKMLSYREVEDDWKREMAVAMSYPAFPEYVFAIAATSWAIRSILDEGFMRDIIKALQRVGDPAVSNMSIDDVIDMHNLRSSGVLEALAKKLYLRTGERIEPTYRTVLEMIFNEPKLGENVQKVLGNPYKDRRGWIEENWDGVNELFELFYGERLDSLMRGRGRIHGLSWFFLYQVSGVHPSTIGRALRRTLEEYLDVRAINGQPFSYGGVVPKNAVMRGEVLIGGIGRDHRYWQEATDWISRKLLDLTKKRIEEIEDKAKRGYIRLVHDGSL